MAAPNRAPGGDPEREVQDLLLVGESLQADFRALEEQRAYLDGLLRDLRRGRETLENLKTAKPGDEVLLPVGAGAYVRANLGETGRVLSSLGAGVVIEDEVDRAAERLERRLANTEQALQRTNEEARRIEADLARINARLQGLSG